MTATSVPVEHLFTLTAETSAPTTIQGGPQGDRMLVRVSAGTFDGPKLRGTVQPNSGGDWVSVRADGSFKLDVRLTLLTDDGAAIYMTYSGIGVRAGPGFALRTAPLFETGAAQHAWLNNVQAVAFGTPGAGSVTYDVYALTL